MPYPKAKVYFDGSHYIAIPHTTRPKAVQGFGEEEQKTMDENLRKIACEIIDKSASYEEYDTPCHTEKNAIGEEDETTKETIVEDGKQEEKTESKTEMFERLYDETRGAKSRNRFKMILHEMEPLFEDKEKTKTFVQMNFRRKTRNRIARNIRLFRKVNLNGFNWFVTFTYDDKIHTEESFRKKLSNALSLFCSRKKWRYIGIWERSPEKQRLHFHGIFVIPEGAIPGEMSERKSYSFNDRKMQTTRENSYFRKHFGLNDFKEFGAKDGVYDAVKYLIKYIEKTGDKLVYSRGLPQYFISDIMDEDVLCKIGDEESKLLLADDFGCWYDGCYMVKVSLETIRLMPKAN